MLALATPAAAGLAQPAVLSRVNAPRALSPLMEEKSQAIPFLNKPPGLDGTMVGDIGFDPLQLSDVVPLGWAREAELKHARVCMLAVAGYVAVDLGFRVPGAPEVSSLVAHDAAVDNGTMLFMLLPITLVELFCGVPKVFQLLNDPDAAAPGDYKFDPMGFKKGSAEAIRTMEMKELANGRTAMLAFSGIVTQAALTGNGFPYTY